VPSSQAFVATSLSRRDNSNEALLAFVISDSSLYYNVTTT
jgi:hypothetical protein